VAETRTNRYWAIAIFFLIAVIIITAFIAWTRYRPSQPIEILLPPEQEISGNITINGAVTNPGIYQFSGDDTIGSLLQSAGGVTADGKPDNLELNIPQTNVAGTPPKNQYQQRGRMAAGSPAGNRAYQGESHYRLPAEKRFF